MRLVTVHTDDNVFLVAAIHSRLLKESEKRQRIEREKKRQSQIVQEQDELIKVSGCVLASCST